MIAPTHLHAMLIHFPIALLLIAFLFQITAFFIRKTFFSEVAFYLLVIGTFGTVGSYLSGEAAGDGMEEGALGIAIELHEQAATIALWLSIMSTLLYGLIFIFKFDRKWIQMIAFVLFAALIGALARTGYLGGQLVYKHGAGVERGLPDFSDPKLDN